MVAQARHFAHDEQRRVIYLRFLILDAHEQLRHGAGHGTLRRRCAAINQRGGIVTGPSVIDEGAKHARDEPRRRKTDQRAVECGQGIPVEAGRRIDLGFVPADEHDRIAGLGMGQRDTGVGRGANRHRDARHDFKRNALFVQEHRFLRAAVEHERIAPLQTRNGVAIANLLCQQHGDGILRDRPFRRRARLNAFGVEGCPPQQRFRGAVVHHHVGLRQQPRASCSDKAGVTRTSTDDEDPSGRRRQRFTVGPK